MGGNFCTCVLNDPKKIIEPFCVMTFYSWWGFISWFHFVINEDEAQTNDTGDFDNGIDIIQTSSTRLALELFSCFLRFFHRAMCTYLFFLLYSRGETNVNHSIFPLLTFQQAEVIVFSYQSNQFVLLILSLNGYQVDSDMGNRTGPSS